MDANTKGGKSHAANIPGSTVWFGMLADDASAKQAICLTMSVHSFWWSPAPALDTSPGISSPASQSSILTRLGRLSLPTPDAGKLKCLSVLLNLRWLLNPLLTSLGSKPPSPMPSACLLPKTGFLFHLSSTYCHTTGQWSQVISAPLYRLPLAPLPPSFPPYINFRVKQVTLLIHPSEGSSLSDTVLRPCFLFSHRDDRAMRCG